MSPAFSPTRYGTSTRRKAKRELLPAMNDTIGLSRPIKNGNITLSAQN
jgi:hypothetical protein